MSKNTNRKGLALGAMFSLVASLFGATPASANPSTSAFFITAAGADTSTFATLVDEDFTIIVTRNPSVVVSEGDLRYLKYSITTDRAASSTTFSIAVETASETNTDPLAVSASNTVTGANLFYGGTAGAVDTNDLQIPGTVTGVEGTTPATAAYVVVPVDGSNWSTRSNKIGFSLHGGVTSLSPTVNITVTAFIDANNNNVFDAGSEVSSTQVIAFRSYASVAPTVTVGSLIPGNTTVTVSATLNTALNYSQLGGKFYFDLVRQGFTPAVSQLSFSPVAEKTITSARVSAGMSDSFPVAAAAAAQTFSVRVGYIKSGNVLDTNGTTNLTENADRRAYLFGAGTSVTVATAAASSQRIYAVKGDNALENGNVRPNSLVTVRVSISPAVAGTSYPITFTFGGATLSTTKTMRVNGGTADTEGTHSSVVVNSNGTTGVAEVTILTSGFTTTDRIDVSASATGVAAFGLVLYPVAIDWTVTADASLIAIAPGGVANVGATVKDQFGVNSARTDQRIRFSWTAGYNGTATSSEVALVAGYASAALTHAPASSTVSGTVTAQLQSFDANANLWSDSSGDSATTNVTVTSNTNGFRVGLARSYSATISYGADFSWSPVINDAYVLVTGSSVVVSGTGLIFKDDVTGKTASNTITLPGDSLARVKFYVTARKAGTYTVTLTAGSATTTSLIVVAGAQDNAGSAIAFDISSMESGRAAIVTGTLTDLNGNPVDTSLGGASVALSVAGTGATYVGSLNTETNANGQFQVALLSGTNQTGTITITAVYSPTTGAAAVDRVTKVHTVSVVAPTAPEVNAVIGSFNGRWAVRVENARGSVVSVKAGNRWVKFSALNNNYLYSMRSVKGRTIAVSVWVDGELQNSQTITIK